MSFSTTFGHFKNYFGAIVATKALTLISIPVLTRILGVTPSDYGVISLFTTYVSIFVILVTLNTYVGVGRYYYENSNDFNDFFGSTVNINLILLIPVSVIALCFTEQLAQWLGITPFLIVLMIPTIAISLASSIFNQVYSARQESSKISKYSIATAYIGFVLTVIFTLLNPKQKYLGSIYSQLITGLIFTILIFNSLKSFYKLTIRKAHIKYMFHYSIPLIPYFLSSVILAQFDRIMIAKYSNTSDAGLYSFAYNIGMIMTLIFSALNSAWIPKYYECFNSKNYLEYNKHVNYINRLMLISALGLIYFGKELGMILGSSSYHASLKIVPIIVIGYLFFYYFYIWMWNIDFAKKNLYSSLIVGIAGMINILLNIILIPRFGYVAAAYTTSISYFCMACFSYLVNRYILKLYAMPVKKLAGPFFIFLLFYSLFYLANEFSNIWFEIGFKITAMIIFSILCFKNQMINFLQKN